MNYTSRKEIYFCKLYSIKGNLSLWLILLERKSISMNNTSRKEIYFYELYS